MGKFRGQLMYYWDGSVGNSPSIEWICIPNKEMRRITLEEMIPLKGITSNRYSNVSLQVLTANVEQHVWAAFRELTYQYLFSSLGSTTTQKILKNSGEQKNTHAQVDAVDP